MHVAKMSKPDDALVNKTNVIESYLKAHSLLPLMLTHGSGDTSGYYYRFLAEFVPGLFAAVKADPAPDLVSTCETKLRQLPANGPPYVPEIHGSNPPRPAHTGREDAVIQLWINLWCRMMPCHEVAEHNYRLEQLQEVLPLYQRKDPAHLVEIHRRIMDTCFRFASARLAIKFFDNINSVSVRANPPVLSMYLAAISSGETAQPIYERSNLSKFASSTEKSKEENNSSKRETPAATMDYQSYFRACTQAFRPRTFLLEASGEVVAEEIKMAHVLPKCDKCGAAPPV